MSGDADQRTCDGAWYVFGAYRYFCRGPHLARERVRAGHRLTHV